MNLLSPARPILGAFPLVHSTEGTCGYAVALARSIDPRIDPQIAAGDGRQLGYILLPNARAAITATRTPMPSWRNECSHHARVTGLDIVLLRTDPVQGMRVDILAGGGHDALLHYRIWKGETPHLWFIPETSAGIFIRATRSGLAREISPPFQSNDARAAGIIAGPRRVRGGAEPWNR